MKSIYSTTTSPLPLYKRPAFPGPPFLSFRSNLLPLSTASITSVSIRSSTGCFELKEEAYSRALRNQQPVEVIVRNNVDIPICIAKALVLQCAFPLDRDTRLQCCTVLKTSRLSQAPGEDEVFCRIYRARSSALYGAVIQLLQCALCLHLTPYNRVIVIELDQAG